MLGDPKGMADSQRIYVRRVRWSFDDGKTWAVDRTLDDLAGPSLNWPAFPRIEPPAGARSVIVELTFEDERVIGKAFDLPDG